MWWITGEVVGTYGEDGAGLAMHHIMNLIFTAYSGMGFVLLV